MTATPVRVLVVDDDPSTRRVINRVLTVDCGCTVEEAPNGLDALARLDAGGINVVVLDLQMPVMDGLETLEAIRASGPHREMPVVVLTGDASETAVKHAVSLGVSAFLTKPIVRTMLSSRFAAILAGTRAAARWEDRFAHEPGGEQALFVLVVDGDAGFRTFLREAIGDRARVAEAETGTQAVQVLLKETGEQERLVVLGPGTGLLSGPLLVRKIRTLPLTPAPAIAAAYPASEVEALRSADTFDAVVARDADAQTLLDELAQVAPELGDEPWEDGEAGAE